MKIQAFPSTEIHAVINQIEVGSDDPGKEWQQSAVPHPVFGSTPDTSSKDFDLQGGDIKATFWAELEANANLTQDQQAQFINVIYDNQEVFSLHNKDLGFCDITHTILTTTNVPV